MPLSLLEYSANLNVSNDFSVSSVFAPAPLCANPLDIVLAIDSSGSMESTWNTTIDNAEILISHFQISKDRTRVSVIDYSAVTNMVMPLDANNTEQDVFRALETLRNIPQFGETWPELALDRASDIFSTANPRRNESRKLIVLFTDGEITSKDADSITVSHPHTQSSFPFSLGTRLIVNSL